MKVLIIGGTGFLSSALVEENLAAGHEVTIISRVVVGVPEFFGLLQLCVHPSGDQCINVRGSHGSALLLQDDKEFLNVERPPSSP